MSEQHQTITGQSETQSEQPKTDDRHPGDIVRTMVERALAIIETWPGWDGEPRFSDDRTHAPHKAVRRLADHLIDHLSEIEARIAGVEPLPDHWHASAVTTPSDLAPFTVDDLDEARSRLTRLAMLFDLRLRTLSDEQLDRSYADGWSPRQLAAHLEGSIYYAESVGVFGR